MFRGYESIISIKHWEIRLQFKGSKRKGNWKYSFAWWIEKKGLKS